jgi:hypothetical protein
MRIFAIIACSAAFSTQAAEPKDFGCTPSAKSQHPGVSLCLPGKTLTLNYRERARSVSITIGGHSHRIERIDRNYGPELIGMEKHIRFLPLELQPYLSRNVVLFNTVVRSSGGEGMGQCGSGAEEYLNAVSIDGARIKVLGKVHVGSCYESIYLDNEEGKETDFSAYSVRDGRLAIKFLSYPEMKNSPTGILSKDFRQLEFSKTDQ